MDDKAWIQCQVCGHLHEVKIRLPEDNLYIYEYCPKCRDETKSLYCGENKADAYFYYNANLDPRYYNYNTK